MKKIISISLTLILLLLSSCEKQDTLVGTTYSTGTKASDLCFKFLSSSKAYYGGYTTLESMRRNTTYYYKYPDLTVYTEDTNEPYTFTFIDKNTFKGKVLFHGRLTEFIFIKEDKQ